MFPFLGAEAVVVVVGSADFSVVVTGSLAGSVATALTSTAGVVLVATGSVTT